MKKKSVLVLSSVLALFLAFTIFTADADALSRRGNDKMAKGQTERVRTSQAAQNDDNATRNVNSKARARKRVFINAETATASTHCVRMGYAGSKDVQNRGFRNRTDCTQDPELCVPARDGSGNRSGKQKNRRFNGTGNPDAGQENRANNGSSNRSGKQKNRRFDGSGNPDAGEAGRTYDGSGCFKPEGANTPKRDGTGNRNR